MHCFYFPNSDAFGPVTQINIKKTHRNGKATLMPHNVPEKNTPRSVACVRFLCGAWRYFRNAHLRSQGAEPLARIMLRPALALAEPAPGPCWLASGSSRLGFLLHLPRLTHCHRGNGILSRLLCCCQLVLWRPQKAGGSPWPTFVNPTGHNCVPPCFCPRQRLKVSAPLFPLVREPSKRHAQPNVQMNQQK